MNLEKYTCDNQISIFDILPTPKKDEPPILLTVGQPVYEVNRGDITEYYVYEKRTWLCGENNMDRGYGLKEPNGLHGTAHNSTIGTIYFTDREQAIQKSEKYFKLHDCIRKEQIKPLEVKTFTYVRDVDQRQMTAFYAILDNDMVYIEGFVTYHHICNGVDKAIKQFMEQQDFRYSDVQEIVLKPNFKNMYPCKNDSGWIYAEAKYNSY